MAAETAFFNESCQHGESDGVRADRHGRISLIAHVDEDFQEDE